MHKRCCRVVAVISYRPFVYNIVFMKPIQKYYHRVIISSTYEGGCCWEYFSSKILQPQDHTSETWCWWKTGCHTLAIRLPPTSLKFIEQKIKAAHAKAFLIKATTNETTLRCIIHVSSNWDRSLIFRSETRNLTTVSPRIGTFPRFSERATIIDLFTVDMNKWIGHHVCQLYGDLL